MTAGCWPPQAKPITIWMGTMATSIRLIQVSTISGDKKTDINNAKLMANMLATTPTAG